MPERERERLKSSKQTAKFKFEAKKLKPQNGLGKVVR
jgi:hypothetical protein